MKLAKAVKKKYRKHKGKLVGGGLGLSAAAVIWMYAAFVSEHEYKKDFKEQQAQNSILWHEIHQLQKLHGLDESP